MKKPTYRIKVNYRTGSSMSSEDTSDYVEIDSNDIDVVKENLASIQEHYKMYEEANSYCRKVDMVVLFNNNKDKSWFVNTPELFSKLTNRSVSERERKSLKEEEMEYRPDEFYATNCINLKLDDGKSMQIYAFWCGYFETLYSAEIVVENEGMKFTV